MYKRHALSWKGDTVLTSVPCVSSLEMYCTKRREVVQRGDEERNFAERAGHLESLGGKKKSDNNQGFWFILFWFCWKYQTCANTHTPLMSSSTLTCTHTHTRMHAHTHNSSDRDRCRDALMHTHTFLVSHTAIVAQRHSPWCFTAVFPGTELSLAQSRLNKNSSHFQLGEDSLRREFFHGTLWNPSHPSCV